MANIQAIKESDLFPPVRRWLEDRGFDVYSEVTPEPYSFSRADVVAVNWPVVGVVELKVHMSLELLEQAVKWKGLAHYVYIASLRPKKGFGDLTKQFLKREGIGLIGITTIAGLKIDGEHCFDARCHLPARFNRRVAFNWREILREEHKSGPPGGHSGGGYVTRYSLMMEKVRSLLGYYRKNGLTIKEILCHCETHYSYPKASLASALLKYEHDWCESYVGEDGKRRFRIKEVR